MKIIVSTDKNWLIGAKGKLPWHIPEELKFFREMTVGNFVIMGRKTWDSLPKKPLPKRHNIIVSRQQQVSGGDYTFVHSLDEAKELVVCKTAFVIGGSEIYKLALEKNLVDEMFVSVVSGDYEGDTYFPDFNKSDWYKTHFRSYADFEVFSYTKI